MGLVHFFYAFYYFVKHLQSNHLPLHRDSTIKSEQLINSEQMEIGSFASSSFILLTT